MTEALDLERLEKETFHQYQHEDGMWDMFMGLLMLFWALGLRFDSTFVSLLMIVPSVVFIAGKALITVPRLGRVRFNDRRLQRERVLIAAVVSAVVVTAMLVALVAPGFGGIDRIGDALFIVMALAIFGLMAYVIQYWRLAVWGAALACVWALTVFVDRDAGAALFVAAGAVAVAAGLWSLRVFMHKYPPIHVEE